MQSGKSPLEANPVTHKFTTVALVPISDDVPVSAFAYERKLTKYLKLSYDGVSMCHRHSFDYS